MLTIWLPFVPIISPYLTYFAFIRFHHNWFQGSVAQPISEVHSKFIRPHWLHSQTLADGILPDCLFFFLTVFLANLLFFSLPRTSVRTVSDYSNTNNTFVLFYNCSSIGATEPVAVITRISTILPQLVCTGKKIW